MCEATPQQCANLLAFNVGKLRAVQALPIQTFNQNTDVPHPAFAKLVVLAQAFGRFGGVVVASGTVLVENVLTLDLDVVDLGLEDLLAAYAVFVVVG